MEAPLEVYGDEQEPTQLTQESAVGASEGKVLVENDSQEDHEERSDLEDTLQLKAGAAVRKMRELAQSIYSSCPVVNTCNPKPLTYFSHAEVQVKDSSKCT